MAGGAAINICDSFSREAHSIDFVCMCTRSHLGSKAKGKGGGKAVIEEH